MKKKLFTLILSIVLSCGIAYGATVIKGQIGEQDFNKWTGTDQTFNRTTSTGGTVTLNKIGYEVDALISFGNGSSYTGATITSALSSIGTTNKAILVLRPGTWTITDDLTIPANVTLRIVPGALLTISTGKTITINGPKPTGLYQVFNCVGTGKVVFGAGSVKFIHPEWWATNTTPGTTDLAAALQAAITASAAVAPVVLTKGVTYATGTRLALSSDVTITGGGTIKALPLGVAVAAEGLLYGTDKNRVKIDGITIDCNPTAQDHTYLIAVFMNSCDDFTFTNNKVVAEYAGVWWRYAGNRANISYNTIDISQMAAPAHGIVAGGNDVIVSHNNITGRQDSITSLHVGIHMGGDIGGDYHRYVCSNNVIYKTYTGIASTYFSNGTIANNSISDCKSPHHSQGIYLSADNHNITVTGNSLSNIDYIAIALTDAIGCTVSNNTITSDTDIATNDVNIAQGIQITAAVVTTGEECSDNIVTGNNIKVAPVAGAADAFRSMTILGNRNIIMGNRMDASGWTASSYGILCNDGSNGIIANNYIATTGSSGIHLTDGVIGLSGYKVRGNIITTTGTNAIYDNSDGNNQFSDNLYLAGTEEITNNQMGIVKVQGTITAKTTAATLTAAELYTRLITGTHAAGATQAYTLPTGTDMDARFGLGINMSFDWVLINLSAAAIDTITLTANTTHAVVGNAIIQSAHSTTGGIYGNSATFRTRKTAANVFITYRIN